MSARPPGPRAVSGARIDQKLARRGGWVELLRLPALAYSAAARANAWLYGRGLRSVLRVDAPVVSVGNLSAGGTGKTPTVAWLARWFQGRGLRPGIVSRGYGARAQGAESNDEARMLARQLPDVPHEQDPDRVAGAQRLVDAGVDVVLMDDGFQHRRLARDLDLVLVDAARPWGLPAPEAGQEPVCGVLPRGLLREPRAALARATALVITRSDTVEPRALARLQGQLAEAAPGVPCLLARHAPAALVDWDGEFLDLARLQGQEVDLLTGVGNPEAVEASIQALGARVGEHRARPDHHPWTAADLAGLGARPVVTTAKDRPKLEELRPLPGGLAPWTLEVELAFGSGAEQLEALLAALPVAGARRQRAALHEGLHG